MPYLRRKGVGFSSVTFENLKSLLEFPKWTLRLGSSILKKKRKGIRTQWYDGR